MSSSSEGPGEPENLHDFQAVDQVNLDTLLSEPMNQQSGQEHLGQVAPNFELKHGTAPAPMASCHKCEALEKAIREGKIKIILCDNAVTPKIGGEKSKELTQLSRTAAASSTSPSSSSSSGFSHPQNSLGWNQLYAFNLNTAALLSQHYFPANNPRLPPWALGEPMIITEAPTFLVPDKEWQEKIVEYCNKSQFYQNWEYGNVGLDSIINPNGPKQFPQRVLEPPKNNKQLHSHFRNSKGKMTGGHEKWIKKSETERMKYAVAVASLKREVELQVMKGWIVQEKRPVLTMKRKMDVFIQQSIQYECRDNL